MDVPLSHPTPSYPLNYEKSRDCSTNDTHREPPSQPTPRRNDSGLSLPTLNGKRNQSFLSLASLNLAQSSSSLLGIFSSAVDSVPPSPAATPPIEIPREKAVIEEIDKGGVIRDTVLGVTVLFALGYAFAMYFQLFNAL